MDKRAQVRRAVESDLPRIVECYPRKADRPWDPFSSVERLKAIPQEGLLVAEAAGAYAGFVYWFEGRNPWFDKGVERYAHIVELQVERQYSGWNTGPVLILEALKEIEAKGYTTVYVDTPEGSAVAGLLSGRGGYVGHMRFIRLRYDYPREKKWDHRNPDDLRMLRVFLVELYEQSRICLTAYSELERLIDHPNASLMEDQEGKRQVQAQIWSRVQAIVLAATVISRILWPNPAPRKDRSDRMIIERGLKLRTFLHLQFAEPPNSKAVRDAFEHIDERLDSWQRPYAPDELPPGWILSPFEKEEEPPETAKASRYFHLFSKELRVGNSSCNLGEVVERVRKVQKMLPQEAQIFLAPPDGWDTEKGEWRR